MDTKRATENEANRESLDLLDDCILAVLGGNPSISQTELASEVGLSRSGLIKRMKRPAFIEALNQIKAEIRTELRNSQLMAIFKLRDLLESDDARLALDAAKCLMALIPKDSVREAARHLVYSAEFDSNGNIRRSEREMTDTELARRTEI